MITWDFRPLFGWLQHRCNGSARGLQHHCRKAAEHPDTKILDFIGLLKMEEIA
jgi:hypothetical protein